MISNPARAREKLARLKRLLGEQPELFLHDEAREKIEQLIDRLEDLRLEQWGLAFDRDLWLALPDAARVVAGRRLRVINLVLHLEACGFDREAAVREVISLAAMPRRTFLKASRWLVVDDWIALRALAIADDFMTRRGLELWLAASEAHPREEFPLSLAERADLDLARHSLENKQERA